MTARKAVRKAVRLAKPDAVRRAVENDATGCC
jgi:hypothetical protein